MMLFRVAVSTAAVGWEVFTVEEDSSKGGNRQT
jgi:hypothetical protein